MVLTPDKPALAPAHPTIPEGHQTFVAIVPDALAFNYRLGLLERLAKAVLDGYYVSPHIPPDVVEQLRGMTRTGERK